MYIKAKNLILNILFPPICLVCEKYLEDSQAKVCLNCLASIPLHRYILCPVCLARVPDINSKPACHPDVHYLLAAASDYRNPAIKTMIKQLKYHGWQSLADDLAEITTGLITTPNVVIKDFIIVPLPLHPSRHRERGFNQAELLATKIGRKLNLPVINDILTKVQNTPAQAKVSDWQARERNISGSFDINNPENLRGKNIILVDDVFTSGATLNEASRVLKLAGAKKIIALVTARAR